jgi:hypothetical protein
MENNTVELAPVSNSMRAGRALMEAFGNATRVVKLWPAQPAKTEVVAGTKIRNRIRLKFTKNWFLCSRVARYRAKSEFHWGMNSWR